MTKRNWQDRVLASTRGRVISALRTGPRTVQELADELELTGNAVRLHLASLERDGLIEQEGVRRAVSKPAHVYRLTTDVEALFPKAYATILGDVLSELRAERGAAGLEAFMRRVGHEAAERAGPATGTPAERIEAAVRLLAGLGGLAEVEEDADGWLIRGFSCPLSAVVGETPEACALAEELVAGVVGARVTECCDRADPPRCRFRIERTGLEG